MRMQKRMWISLKRLFFLSTALLLSPTLLAANAVTNHDAVAAAARRKLAPAEISEKEAKFIQKWFFKVPESQKLEFQDANHLERHLPYGITDALDAQNPDESIMGTVLANLASFRSRDQIVATRDAAKAKASEERKKEGKELDKRFLALLERTEWAMNWLLETPIKAYPTEPESPLAEKEKEVARFNKAFAAAWPDAEKKKLETLDYLKKAKESGVTGTQAREWLMKNLDLRSLPSELTAGVTDPEAKKVQDDLLSVLPVGGKFHFSHLPGVAQTLRADPNPEKNREALTKFVARMGDASKVSFTATPNQAVDPDQDWWINPQGEIVNAASAKTPSSGNTGSIQANGSPNEDVLALQRLVQSSNCGTCHSRVQVSGSTLADTQIQVGGRTVGVQSFVSAVQKVPQMKVFRFNPTVQRLEQWALANR